MTTTSLDTVINGSLVWKIGQMWAILPPNDDGSYSKERIKYTNVTPNGITNIPTGKGSLKRSLHIIGKPPDNLNANVDMGWFQIHVYLNNGQPQIDLTGGKQAATKRWVMERHHQAQQVIQPSNQSYQQPSGHEDVKQLTILKRANQVRDQAYWEWLRSEVYIRDKGICWVCNEFVTLRDYDLGHLVDRSNGGADDIENCAVMHKICNITKPRHNSIAEASAWRLTPKAIHTHLKQPKTQVAQLSLTPQ